MEKNWVFETNMIIIKSIYYHFLNKYDYRNEQHQITGVNYGRKWNETLCSEDHHNTNAVNFISNWISLSYLPWTWTWIHPQQQQKDISLSGKEVIIIILLSIIRQKRSTRFRKSNPQTQSSPEGLHLLLLPCSNLVSLRCTLYGVSENPNSCISEIFFILFFND